MLEYGHTASMKCKPDGKLRSQQYSYVALHSFKRSILKSYFLCVSAPLGKSLSATGAYLVYSSLRLCRRSSALEKKIDDFVSPSAGSRSQLNEDAGPDPQEFFSPLSRNAASGIGDDHPFGSYSMYYDVVFEASDQDVSDTRNQNAIELVRPRAQTSCFKADFLRCFNQLQDVRSLKAEP